MAAHICETCGLLHDMPAAPEESDEVKIARINAERDMKVAQLSARQDREWNETRVEVAEIEAEAAVETAEVQAEVIGAAIEASDLPPAEPVEIIAPEIVNDVDNKIEDAPPELEGSPEPVAEKKTTFGMW